MLAETYPIQHFKEFSLTQQTGNEKIDADFQFQLEFFNLQKTDKDSLKALGFNTLWIQFIHLLLSKEYLQQLGQIANLDLTHTKSLIEFSRYRPGELCI